MGDGVKKAAVLHWAGTGEGCVPELAYSKT